MIYYGKYVKYLYCLEDKQNKLMYKYNKADLVAQTKILSPKIAKLLGMYFVCEKVAKHLTKNEVSDGKLYLQILKKWIKIMGISVNKNDLDLIFTQKLIIKIENHFEIYEIKYVMSVQFPEEISRFDISNYIK